VLKGPLKPNLNRLLTVSPSTFKDLKCCHLKVAFNTNPENRTCFRPTPGTCLGNVCHKLYEMLTNGKYEHISDQDIENRLRLEWGKLIEKAYINLSDAWEHTKVPEPERWPRYQIVRIRFLSFLHREYLKRGRASKTEPRNDFEVKTEEGLKSSDGKIIGRPDRVETKLGQVEIVDLKTNTYDLTPEQEISLHRQQLLIYAYLWWDVNKVWPTRASIQELTGERFSFEISPEECETVRQEFLEELQSFNTEVETKPAAGVLASPSSSSCMYCHFKGGCRAFWAAIDSTWDWYRKSFLGPVLDIQNEGDTKTLIVLPEKANLSLINVQVRLLGVSSLNNLQIKENVAVMGAYPTNSKSDFRAGWDTSLWQFEGEDLS
jgi:RecB family exonuclease